MNMFLKKYIGQATVALLMGSVACRAVWAEPAGESSQAAPAKPLSALMLPRADHDMLLGIAAAGNDLIAVGGNGVILRSSTGQDWRQVACPVDSALTGVAFADNKHGWAVGHDAVILGTQDGGASWTIQNFQPDLYSPIFAILPVSAQRVIAVGAFGLIKMTEDGGVHWVDVDAPEISKDKLHLNAITRLNDGKFAVAGESGLVGVSADGTHWTRANVPYDGSFFGILPWGASGALAYGMRGHVFVNANLAGGQWQQIPTATTASFFGGEKLADGRVLLTGAEGTIIFIDQDGHVKPYSGTQMTRGVGLTGSLALKDALIVIGESGVRSLPGTALAP